MRDRLRQHPAPQRGQRTGPNPADRSKKGSKIHPIIDRQGLSLSVGISAANLHDSQALIPLVRGIPPIRSRRGPRRRQPGKLRGDKGYDCRHLLGVVQAVRLRDVWLVDVGMDPEGMIRRASSSCFQHLRQAEQ